MIYLTNVPYLTTLLIMIMDVQELTLVDIELFSFLFFPRAVLYYIFFIFIKTLNIFLKF